MTEAADRYHQIPSDGIDVQPVAARRWLKASIIVPSGCCLLLLAAAAWHAQIVSAAESIDLLSIAAKNGPASARLPRQQVASVLRQPVVPQVLKMSSSRPLPPAMSSLRGSDFDTSDASSPILRAHEDLSGDYSIGRREATAALAAAAASAAAMRAAAADAAESVPERSSALQNNVGPWDFVILGAGNAGGYAARELVKQLGPDVKGRVLLIGSEPVVPYERPALTKAYLHPPGAKVRARLPGFHTSVGVGGDRQTPEWYEERGVGVLTSKPVTKVDAKKRTLTLAGGEEVKYGKLFFCTGASARKATDVGIADDTSSGVYYVREEADAAALVSALDALKKASDEKQKPGKVVLVGGGYIGLEVAAAAAGWGFDSTVIDPDAAPLARVFPAQYSEKFRQRYEDAGVKFKFSSKASSFNKNADGSFSGVVLKDGQVVPADLAVVGVGATANSGLLKGQVKEQDGGILVDSQMQTSDPNIYAFGDVATFPLGKATTRLEHVSHARSSAGHAVQAALGKNPGPYKIVPYFYSRVFEYTDRPLVWQLYGEQKGTHAEFKTPSGAPGEVWVDSGKVVGALVFGCPPPSKEDTDLAKAVVTEGKAAKTAEDAAALISSSSTAPA
eukprot:gnl/TRDRNA2_/TRDRNA2_167160_c0_seq2.p1 gnl/TRDRNA2_/TRDRNA2_167160_c0~~gnl/TRDRNA2_/TRDRNA2_167160_c0_seq2.p1  ORF type:complete len:618 (+),score=127.42 gnl/TRDRNA2_/TRDRNA2_167160_c0_seq2:57-1910(+)